MFNDIQVSVFKDTALPAIRKLAHQTLSKGNIFRAVGTACVQLTKDHLNSLGPNKQGWPSTGFYAGAARGTSWEQKGDGVSILVDNENAPGAMRQRFHGGTITAKDHLLTIPARAEFYGKKATSFTNLRLAVFKSGSMALVVGSGGTDVVNFKTGKSKGVRGARESMVAYWLKDSVYQAPDPGVMPTPDQYAEAALNAVVELVRKGKQKGHGEE